MQIDTARIKISTKTVLAALTAVGAFAQTPFGQSLILHHAQLASAAAFVASALALLHNPVVEKELGIDPEQSAGQ